MTTDRSATIELTVAGANCPWCFNDTLDELRAEPGVVAAAGSMAGQCIRVEHHDVAIDRLLAVVRGRLHADGQASAEHVMVTVDPELAERHCPHHGTA